MNEETRTAAAEQELSEILQIRRDKLAALQEAGRDPFRITRFDVTHHSSEVCADFAALEGRDVSVAGRMMVKRVMGKASFEAHHRHHLLQAENTGRLRLLQAISHCFHPFLHFPLIF